MLVSLLGIESDYHGPSQEELTPSVHHYNHRHHNDHRHRNHHHIDRENDPSQISRQSGRQVNGELAKLNSANCQPGGQVSILVVTMMPMLLMMMMMLMTMLLMMTMVMMLRRESMTA